MPEQLEDDEQSPDMFLSTSIYHIQQYRYFSFLIKLRYTLTCEVTTQENEMARCMGEHQVLVVYTALMALPIFYTIY